MTALSLTLAISRYDHLADPAGGQAPVIRGSELWPYGVDANRATLDVFLQYAFEQDVCHRRLRMKDLFPKQLHSAYRV